MVEKEPGNQNITCNRKMEKAVKVVLTLCFAVLVTAVVIYQDKFGANAYLMLIVIVAALVLGWPRTRFFCMDLCETFLEKYFKKMICR